MTFQSKNPAVEAQAAKAISKARANLVLTQPFFGTLALKLTPAPTYEEDTFATDGVHLFYNPEFALTLSGPQLTGVVAHEVMHNAMAHHARRGGRDHDTWNEAGDYTINGILNRAKFELPKGALLDPSYDGQSADVIYADLNRKKQSSGNGSGQQPQAGQQQQQGGAGGQQPQGQQQAQPQGGQGQGQGGQQRKDFGNGCGRVIDAPNASTEAGRAEAEREWKVAVAQAAQAARAAGKLPAEVDRMVREFMAPEKDWRELLRRFCTSFAREDYSWSRPNRRFAAQGLYLPSLHSERVGSIACVVDTSASIRQAELSAFAGELNSIVADVKPASVVVAYCDARVHAVERIDPAAQELAFEAKGGGGTNMTPAFEAVMGDDDAQDRPVALVCFTDMEMRFPEDPGVPVIWVAVGKEAHRAKPPYGEVIPFDLAA